MRFCCQSVALVATTLIASNSLADVTATLNLANARMTSGSVSIGTVGGRSNVATLNSAASPGYANIWGTATGGSGYQSGFGMNPSGNSGVGGWAGSSGALLSDITSASFDWYNPTGGLGGGFRLAMYVYAPTSQGDVSGYLQFDLTYLLPNQTAAQWNSTGNMLAGAVGNAWYSADYGPSQFSGYQSWAQIQTTLAGWSVYEIGIINDTGYSASIDNLAVSFVPAPGAIALLGAAGLVGRRRRN